MYKKQHQQVSQRPTHDTFQTNLQQFQETDKLLAHIEYKITDFVNKSRAELDTPSHQDIGNFEPPDSAQSNVKYSVDTTPYYRVSEQENMGIDTPSSLQNLDPESRGPYSQHYRNQSAGAPESDPQYYEPEQREEEENYYDDADGADLSNNRSPPDESPMLISSKEGSERYAPVREYRQRVQEEEEEESPQGQPQRDEGQSAGREQSEGDTGRSNNNNNEFVERAAKIEAFYMNKVGMLEERIAADGREIYGLRKLNEDLRLEIVRLRNEMNEIRQAQSQEIWKHFHQQKEQIQRISAKDIPKDNNRESYNEGRGSVKDHSNSLKYSVDNPDSPEVNVRKSLKGNSQREDSRYNKQPTRDEGGKGTAKNYHYSQATGPRDNHNRESSRSTNTKNVVESMLHGEDEARSESQYQGEQAISQENEKIGFLFSLITKYKHEVDLLKEGNVLIKQQLEQQIRHLKNELLSQREQNSLLAQVLQNERQHNPLSNPRNTSHHKPNKSQQSDLSIAQRQSNKDESRVESVKQRGSYKDNSMISEDNRPKQLKTPKDVHSELTRLGEKAKEQYRQFDEAYRKIYNDHRDKGNVHMINPFSPTQEGKTKSRVRDSVGGTSPSAHGSPSSRKRLDTLKESLKKDLGDISSAQSINEIEDENIPRFGGSIVSVGSHKSPKRTGTGAGRRLKTASNNVNNVFMAKYDDFCEELRKVKNIVQEKIAEKDGDSPKFKKSGSSKKDSDKPKKRSTSKGNSINMRG